MIINFSVLLIKFVCMWGGFMCVLIVLRNRKIAGKRERKDPLMMNGRRRGGGEQRQVKKKRGVETKKIAV